MRKPTLFLCFFAFIHVAICAQHVLRNRVSGEPLASALVFDDNGNFMGLTNQQGELDAQMIAANNLHVVHYACLPAKFNLKDNASKTLYMSPIVQPAVQKRERMPDHKYIKVRGWRRFMQIEDQSLQFLTEGIVEYFIPINGKGKIKTRLEGMQTYMAKGMNASQEVNTNDAFGLRFYNGETKEILKETDKAVVKRILNKGKQDGTLTETKDKAYCFVDIPNIDAFAPYNFKFFKVSFKHLYSSLSQTYMPVRTDSDYKLLNLAAVQKVSAFDTHTKKVDSKKYFVEMYYILETEFLTTSEAQNQMRIKPSTVPADMPPSAPMLSPAIEHLKASFVPVKR